MNDDIELALILGADGIHVGQDDRQIQEVIALCGTKMKVGLSVSTVEEAVVASRMEGIDYLGAGPIFATRSKSDAKAPSGVVLLKQMRDLGITLPVVAIGGITIENVDRVLQAGADGVAVISVLTRAAELEGDIEKLKGNCV